MRCLDPHVTLLNAIDELLWIEFHVAGWNLEQLLRLRSFLNVRHLDGGAVIGLELHDEVDAGIDPYEIPVLARRDSPVFNGAAPRSTRRRCARNAMWGLDWSHQRFAPWLAIGGKDCPIPTAATFRTEVSPMKGRLMSRPMSRLGQAKRDCNRSVVDGLPSAQVPSALIARRQVSDEKSLYEKSLYEKPPCESTDPTISLL